MPTLEGSDDLRRVRGDRRTVRRGCDAGAACVCGAVPGAWIGNFCVCDGTAADAGGNPLLELQRRAVMRNTAEAVKKQGFFDTVAGNMDRRRDTL